MTDRERSIHPVYTAAAEATFNASHAVRLPNGDFEPTHEHCWRVTVTFASPTLDGHDMVVDFCDVLERLSATVSAWEGRNLNAEAAFSGTTPTAERVAQRIFEALADVGAPPARLVRVCVEEAPGCTGSFGEPA